MKKLLILALIALVMPAGISAVSDPACEGKGIGSTCEILDINESSMQLGVCQKPDRRSSGPVYQETSGLVCIPQ